MSSRIFSCTSGWSMTLIRATPGAPGFPFPAGAALPAGAPFAAEAFFAASVGALPGMGALIAPFFSPAGLDGAGAVWPLLPFAFATGFLGSGATGALALLAAGADFFSGFLGSRVFPV